MDTNARIVYKVVFDTGLTIYDCAKDLEDAETTFRTMCDKLSHPKLVVNMLIAAGHTYSLTMHKQCTVLNQYTVLAEAERAKIMPAPAIKYKNSKYQRTAKNDRYVGMRDAVHNMTKTSIVFAMTVHTIDVKARHAEKPVTIDNITYESAKDAAKKLNLPYATIIYRLSSTCRTWESWHYVGQTKQIETERVTKNVAKAVVVYGTIRFKSISQAAEYLHVSNTKLARDIRAGKDYIKYAE